MRKLKQQYQKARIMRGALESVAERGLLDTSMAMIAERSDVGVGTIYRYFYSKEDLLLQTHADLEQRLYQVATDGVCQELETREGFLQMAKNLLGYCISSPSELNFLLQFRCSPYRYRLVGRPGGQDKKKDLADGLFPEWVRWQAVKDLPPAILFELSFGPLFQIAQYHHTGELIPDDATIGSIIESAWSAIEYHNHKGLCSAEVAS